MMKPFYYYKPIYNEKSLLKALGMSKEQLACIVNSKEKYRADKIYIKGKERVIHQPIIKELKYAQEAIKKEFLGSSKIHYPDYLQGSLKGKSIITNASYHLNASLSMHFDIKNFFPNCSEEMIFNIWRHLFKFSHDVSEILTILTTHNGFLPQGICTSSYLANLSLFRYEHILADKISKMKGRYSRYVDDMVISFKENISKIDRSNIVKNVIYTLKKYGLSINRRKFSICNQEDKKNVTGINIHGNHLSTDRKRRDNIRSMLFNLFHEKDNLTRNELKLKIRKIEGHINYIISTNTNPSKKIIFYKENILNLKKQHNF